MFSKKIVAGAALLALAAAAQAQVKVYGYVDLGFGSFESAGTNTKSVTKVDGGNLMTSFIGFTGSEDLGGGLKAEFALETFIGADTGSYLANNASSTGFWGRASWIGLGGSFGRVIIGQYDTPLFVSGLSYNPFGSSMLLSPTMRHYYGLSLGVAGTGRTLTTDTGWVNSLTYETPNLSGFTATAQWSPKESSTSGTKDSFTLGAAYNAGPLSLMAVYADHGMTDVNAAYAGKQKVWALNASYDFAVAKGFFQYTSVDNSNTSVDDAAWQIGATVPVSPSGNVMVSYGELKEDTTATTTTKNKIFSLGYDHSLSKRTGAYVAFTTERATNLDSGNSFVVGVRHAF
jgi:predicted porin